MNANVYVIEDYENETAFRPKKTNPIQTQTNPILERMNVNFCAGQVSKHRPFGKLRAGLLATAKHRPIKLSSLHVGDIAMSSGKAGPNYYALATVWVIDDVGADVVGATVYGQWSGDVSGTSSGVTGADGKVTLQSPKKKKGGNFIFTVTDVVAPGYIYDEALNAETSDSVTAP